MLIFFFFTYAYVCSCGTHLALRRIMTLARAFVVYFETIARGALFIKQQAVITGA